MIPVTETPSSTVDIESGETTSDDASGPADERSGSPGTDQESPDDDGNGPILPHWTDLVEFAYKGAFAVLLLLALFATVQAYLSAGQAINIWVARGYRPIFHAAFNVGVVLICGIGLSVLFRRVR